MQATLAAATRRTRGKNEDQQKQHAREDSGRIIEYEIRNLCERLAQRSMQYDADTRCGEDRAAQLRYDGVFASLR